MIKYKELDISTVYFTEVIDDTTTTGVIYEGTDAWDELDHTLVAKETELEKTTKLQEKATAAALRYLSYTDWYIIRQVESEIPTPDKILTARAEARTKVVR